MKLLTLVIPVYNTEKYLDRCLDSVLTAETVPFVQVVAVNDGSTDSSIEILKRYKEGFGDNFVIIDKENGGHGSAVNAGVKAATGKYLRILDSDDWFDTHRFVSFLHSLSKCDEDLIITPYTQVHTYSNEEVRFEYGFLESGVTLSLSDIRFNTDTPIFALASSTYKVSLLRKCGLELFEKTFYVDMQFNIYPIPYLETVRYLDLDIYRYFIGRPEQSMSDESLRRHLPDHLKVLRFLIDYYAEFEGGAGEARRYYMGLLIYLMYYTATDLVCMKHPDRKAAYDTFKDLDGYLKKRAPAVYRWVGDFPYVRVTRALGYINVRFGNRAVAFALDTLRRIRRKNNKRIEA